VSLSEPFIRRPVGTSLLTAAVALSGWTAFRQLPVAALPQVDFPTVQVSASLPGASPETMASSVATPLERQFGRIAGVTEMTSTSYLGSTGVVLQFDLSRNGDSAARDVQAGINAARGNLPANLPSNPTWRKVNPADAPILILALTSDVETVARMYDAASSILAQRLSQIGGVGQVLVGGSALPGVRVELNPTAMNRYGLGMDALRTFLGSANSIEPKGEIADGSRAIAISATDQLLKADEYAKLIVAYRNGSPVHLSSLGTVVDSVEDLRNAGVSDGKPSVLIIIFRQPGANIIDTVDRVYDAMPLLQASVPASVHIGTIVDRTITIRASVADVEHTLLISILLVILVVFAFLRNPVATFIPSVVVPLSLIGTFGVMYMLDYSLDNLSLMALTISTGFVVDDAIVVIENITRYIEMGMGPLEASLKGSAEIGFTVVSMSISLVAVFIPILMMTGIVGRLFREFAVTLSVAIIVSMFISLTATPMMCAQFLKHESADDHGVWYNRSEAAFQWMLDTYARGLRFVLNHQRLTLLSVFIAASINVCLFVVIPKGFFPQQDTGRMQGGIQAEQDISFQLMRDKLYQFAAIVQADPAVQDVVAFCGGSGGTNAGRMFVGLKDKRPSSDNIDAVMARIRRKTAGIPGARLFLQAVQDIKIGGRSSNALYQYTLQSADLEMLKTWAPKMFDALKALQPTKLVDVNTDQQNNGLQSWLTIDREAASRLGLTAQNVDDALYDAFGQRQVSTMDMPMNEYHVVMEVAPEYWQSPDTLKTIYAHTPSGADVPLASFTRLQTSFTPLVVNHQGFFPSVTLSFNLPPGVSLGEAVDAITQAQKKMGLPKAISGTFAGTAQAFKASLSNEPVLIATALIAVYIVLGMLYESYIHPITILSTLPSAGVGALLALLVTGTDLSVIALIGIILLIGIVKKNAIMMIDFALDAQRREGKSPRDAIYEACLLRFRPITMTTMAALLGAVPLALGTGTGSELRRPLGIAIVGGLVVSQMLTLFTTPIVYLYMEELPHALARLRDRLSGRLSARGVAQAPGT
jgi:multidrug efflux pump